MIWIILQEIASHDIIVDVLSTDVALKSQTRAHQDYGFSRDNMRRASAVPSVIIVIYEACSSSSRGEQVSKI